jgi:LDH2 family malate/lactate/ureidoglycolate dehydrogenase
MDRLIRAMKSTPPATGYSEVLVAGEPELRIEQERAATGIPVGHGTWHALCQVADRLGVAVPQGEPKRSS